MKGYNCTKCNYSTHDKSNFNKHMNSKAHAKKSQSITKNESKILPSKFECTVCGGIYASASNLTRHIKHYCTKKGNEFIELKEKLNLLEIKNKDLENEVAKTKLEAENKMLKQQVNDFKLFIQSGKAGNTYNIAIDKYIQQSFPDAPGLFKLEDYSVIKNKNKNDNDDNDDNDDLIDILVSMFDNNKLHAYLGNFIIKYYKKDDPSQQSLWNSDTSRFTYLIREFLVNKKLCWNRDPKGIKTKEYIIDPLLKYIRDYILEFNINKPTKILKENELKDVIRDDSLRKILLSIKNKTLANDIINYISPYFYINNKNNNITDDRQIQYTDDIDDEILDFIDKE